MRVRFASALLLVGACSSGHSDEQQRPLDRLHQDPRCDEAATFDAREPGLRGVSSNGVVSSERIAKDVAFRYLNSVYPNDRTLRRLKATLANGVWTVNGTLPKERLGGAAGISLCQSNGRVLEVAHGK